MKLLTKEIKKKLIANREATQKLEDEGADLTYANNVSHKPVVKFFGGSSCTWLITEMYDDDTLFGLCDLGLGFPELGYVSLKELESLKFPPFGLGVERDLYFTASKTISEYADEARMKQRIVA
tara:strand:+ start:14612 stop:14980 length:369 start_codon:yes stop_codon:yes gene_type:complete